MDSYTGTFSAADAKSPILLVRAGESAHIELTTAALTGSVALDNFDSSQGFYKTVKSYVAAVDEVFINDSGADMRLRLRCVAIGGGQSVDYTLEEVAGETVQVFRNQAGEIVLTLTDEGIRTPKATIGEATIEGGTATLTRLTADVVNLGNDVILFAGDGAPDDGVKATLSTALAGDNNDLDFTAVAAGVEGNDIEIEYEDPAAADAVLAVTVTGTLIKVSLATDGDELITTTASEIITAIEADAEAAALVTVALKGADTGAGVVTALASTALATGAGTGVGTAGPGSQYTDLDGPALYLNTGTKAMPVWEQLEFAA